MSLIRMIARLFGYIIIKKKKNPLDVSMYVSNLIKHLNINCVIDVGANRGQYALSLRANGYKDHIFSFEPLRENYAILLALSQKDPKWHIFNVALGNEDSKKPIHVANATEFSSFLKPSTYSKNIFEDQVSINKVEEVPIRRLDSIKDDITGPVPQPRIYLKMDTQGYDLEVFRGAGALLQNVLALQSEISVFPLYDGMTDYIQSLTQYRNSGFEVSAFYPVCHNAKNLALIEFDCVMVNVRSSTA